MTSVVRPLLFPRQHPKFRGSYILAAYGQTIPSPPQNSSMFSFRWVPSVSGCIAVVRSVGLRVFTFTAHTGGITPAAMAVVKVSGFTAADSGGVAITPLARDTGYPASLAEVRAISGGAALTSGTRTLLSPPVVVHALQSAVQLGISADAPRFELGTDDPMILRLNDGLLVVPPGTTTGGSYIWQLDLQWIELASGATL